MYIHSFFSAPLSSLIMNHLLLSSHDDYSETHSDNGYYLQVIPLYRSVLLRQYSETQSDKGYYLQVIPLYRSVLFSKCTSIHCSLHPCLPLIWIISDCLFMLSIRRHTQTKATTYKSFQCTEVFCCLNVHLFIVLCTLVFPYYESSLIVFSWWVFRDTWRPQPANYKSFHCTYVSCCLNVHPFILLCTLVFPYNESSLIVFSWWVFGDTLRQWLLLTSHSTVHKCSVV